MNAKTTSPLADIIRRHGDRLVDRSDEHPEGTEIDLEVGTVLQRIADDIDKAYRAAEIPFGQSETEKHLAAVAELREPEAYVNQLVYTGQSEEHYPGYFSDLAFCLCRMDIKPPPHLKNWPGLTRLRPTQDDVAEAGVTMAPDEGMASETRGIHYCEILIVPEGLAVQIMDDGETVAEFEALIEWTHNLHADLHSLEVALQCIGALVISDVFIRAPRGAN